MKRARACTSSSNCGTKAISDLEDNVMESSSKLPAKASRRLPKPLVVVDVHTDSKEGRRQLESGRDGEGQYTCKHTDTSTSDSGGRHEGHSENSSSASIQIPPCMLASNSRCREILRNAPFSPPCTVDTLRELDLHAIQHNLNLRVDLCYDHDLFFQPISGKKGESKRTESEKYWRALAVELTINFHNAQSFCNQCSVSARVPATRFKPRLPLMFSNLREIIEMLVPESEHGEIANQLDVDFLMQQVGHATLDIVRLSEWLAGLLTSHCAPKRDDLAREVTTDIRAGTEQADMQLIVAGLEKLFSLLESMKLDVANHQIRAFRFPLIDDTVPFQQDCFSRAIANRSLDISRSQRWFRQARAMHEESCMRDSGDESCYSFHSLVHGLVRLCDPAIKRVPNTLQYDYHRFVRLQEDLQDLVQIELCLQVFERRVFEINHTISRAQIVATHEALKSRVIALTEDEDGNGGAISDHLDAISIELTRAAFNLAVSGNPQLEQGASEGAVHDFEFERTNKALYEYFQAEDDEETILSKFLSTLEFRTIQYAQQFLPLSTLDLSNRQRQWTQARNKAGSKNSLVLADWDDMARRLAHIAAGHWKVWAELCYLESDNMDITADLTSPISVYGDERFYGDEISDLYSPSISSASTFGSPLASQQPFTNSEFQKGIAAMQQGTFPRKDPGVGDGNLADFTEDGAGTAIGGQIIERDFDIDTGKGASMHLRKSSARRKSL